MKAYTTCGSARAAKSSQGSVSADTTYVCRLHRSALLMMRWAISSTEEDEGAMGAWGAQSRRTRAQLHEVWDARTLSREPGAAWTPAARAGLSRSSHSERGLPTPSHNAAAVPGAFERLQAAPGHRESCTRADTNPRDQPGFQHGGQGCASGGVRLQ